MQTNIIRNKFMHNISTKKLSMSSFMVILLFIFSANLYFVNNAQAAIETEAEKADRIASEINALSRYIKNEIDEDMAMHTQSREAFLEEYKRAKEYKEKLQTDLERLENTYHRQNLLINTLELEAAKNEDSRKALQGASSLNASLLEERLQFSPYVANGFIDFSALSNLVKTAQFPSFEDIDALLQMQLKEVTQSAEISLQSATVYTADGYEQTSEILTVGGFFALAKNDTVPSMLISSAHGERLMHAPRELTSKEQEEYRSYLSSTSNILPMDLSKGELFLSPAVEKGYFEHVLDGGFLVWPILILGALAFSLGVWRYIKLSTLNLGSKEIFAQFYNLVSAGKFEEAKELLINSNKNDVITYNMLIYMLSNWNETVVSLEKSYEEAMLIFMNPLEKGIGFIGVAAAAAPLMGLFGTVTGMISTFDVITVFGNSDPKLLSGGISIALVTTEVGMLVAIPLMFLHFLVSRKLEVVDQFLDTKGAICLSRACSHLVESALSGYVADNSKVDNKNTLNNE